MPWSEKVSYTFLLARPSTALTVNSVCVICLLCVYPLVIMLSLLVLSICSVMTCILVCIQMKQNACTCLLLSQVLVVILTVFLSQVQLTVFLSQVLLSACHRYCLLSFCHRQSVDCPPMIASVTFSLQQLLECPNTVLPIDCLTMQLCHLIALSRISELDVLSELVCLTVISQT